MQAPDSTGSTRGPVGLNSIISFNDGGITMKILTPLCAGLLLTIMSVSASADVSVDYSSQTIVNWGQRFGRTILEENHDCRDNSQDRLAGVVALTKGNLTSVARFTGFRTTCDALQSDGTYASDWNTQQRFSLDVTRSWQSMFYEASSIFDPLGRNLEQYPSGISLQTNATGRSLTGLWLRFRTSTATFNGSQFHYWAPLNSSAFYQGSGSDADAELLCPAGEVVTRVRYFYQQPQSSYIVIKGVQIRCNPLLEN